MAVYPIIYRAKAVQATATKLTAYVPQVFGDVSVEITDFLGPPVAGMGWVFFQAGNPEHPVWTTRVASEGQADWSEEITELEAADAALDTRLDVIEQGGGDSSDEVWVGPNAPIGGQELWYDPDVSGVTLFSGGGPSVNEVFVGPTDPIATDPDIELWFDTDAPGALPQDQRWYTAWGLVGAASSSDIAVSAAAPGTTIRSVTLSLTAGRQYTVEARQLSSYVTGATNANSFQLYLDLDGAVYNNYSTAYPIIVDGAYVTPANVSWNLTATTGSHTVALRLVRNSGTGTMQARFHLMVYDVGPVSGSAAMPMPVTDRWNTAWGNVAVGSFTAGYLTATGSAVTITNPITFTTVVGRRYRLRLQIRVIHNPAAGVLNVTFTGMPANDSWTTFTAGQYNSARYEMPFDGTGVAATYNVNAYSTPTGTGLWLDSASFFVLEDVGPVSGAVPVASPTPAWTPLTLTANWTRYDLIMAAPAYRKVGDEVQVRGYLKAVAGAQSPVCVLPVGFRPPYDLEFPNNIWNNNEATLILGYIVVRANGDVVISAPSWIPPIGCPIDFRFSVTT